MAEAAYLPGVFIQDAELKDIKNIFTLPGYTFSLGTSQSPFFLPGGFGVISDPTVQIGGGSGGGGGGGGGGGEIIDLPGRG